MCLLFKDKIFMLKLLQKLSSTRKNIGQHIRRFKRHARFNKVLLFTDQRSQKIKCITKTNIMEITQNYLLPFLISEGDIITDKV